VGVDDSQGVADQFTGDAFQDQGRAEDGVPAADAERAGAELGGAAVGDPGGDRCPGRDVAGLGGLGADRPDRCPRANQGREDGGRHAQRVEHLFGPGLVDQVGTGLQRVAEVGGHITADEAAVDEVVLVRQSRVRDEVGVFPEQPQQVRQGPRRLHALVAEVAPDRVPGLVHSLDLTGCPGVVVHEPGGQRGALLVDEEDRPGRGVHGHPGDVVSDRLGHASATITLTVYQHVHPGMGCQAADRFAALLQG
jgi:hypothetical protein